MTHPLWKAWRALSKALHAGTKTLATTLNLAHALKLQRRAWLPS